jgi:hypothetical protein
MNKRTFLPLILGIVCLICVSIPKSEAAKPIFFADFDGKGTPDDSVNDPANWKAENPSNTWGTGAFPANGTNALKMTGSGCGSSSFTPFPTVENWKDGIIQADFGWFDDDSWGIMFRRNGEMEGYFVFLGFTETIDWALFDLGQIGLLNGKCLNEAPGVEEGPEPGRTIIRDKAIGAAPHNLEVDQTGATSYTARIVANGSKIKIWYGPTDDFPDDPLKEPTDVANVIEAEDTTYTEGSVGLWQESNDNGVVDNIYVFDKSALAVSSQWKTAITWGGIKER